MLFSNTSFLIWNRSGMLFDLWRQKIVGSDSEFGLGSDVLCLIFGILLVYTFLGLVFWLYFIKSTIPAKGVAGLA